MKILIHTLSYNNESLKNELTKSDNKTFFSYDLEENFIITFNKKLKLTNWDLLIPLMQMIDFEEGFDTKIREAYKQHYPNLDGVLLLKNEDESITIPVIGKNYIKEFGYIYNPIYTTEVAEKEFYEILKLKEKYTIIKDILFNRVELVKDDDKVHEFRKKFNFGVYKINKLRNFKRKKSATKNEFNKLVDECYVINLERRKDRMERMINELKKIDVSYRIFNAVDGLKIKDRDNIISNPEVATIKSHMGVIKDAIYNEYDKIAIFEDDIIFCDDFDKRLKYYIENIPKDWDIMYLGSNLNSCQEPALIKHGIYKVKESYGCFAIILNNKNGLFQKIVNGENYNIPYDNYIRSLQKELNCYVFKPFFVKTLYTQSDINPDRGEFSYDIVDKYFAPVFEEPKPVQNEVQSAPKPQIESRTIQSICEDYQRGNYPFIIYYGGRVLFDSQYTDKSNIRFDKEYFILYGKYFPYRGMVIKRK